MVALLSVRTGVSLLRRSSEFDFILDEAEFLDATDGHAGHFNGVADLEFLDVVEAGAEMVAGLEDIKPADDLHDDESGEDGEENENAKPGFQ